MLFLLTNPESRPDRFTETKDESYHARWGRYTAFDANGTYHSQFIEKTKRNKRFYKGDQWNDPEDLEAFFKDESGQNRNRIQIIQNLIRPMVEQYRGNAIRMEFNARVRSVSPMAITRREKMLETMKWYTDVANQQPSFSEALKKRLPIGDNHAETEEIFENNYVDKFVRKINMLLSYVSELNAFTDKQVRVAEELALSGLSVMENFEYSGNQRFEILRSEDFFFDHSAKEYNLTDAEYMGKIPNMLPTEIYEHFPNISQPARESIENYARQYKKITADEPQFQNGGRVAVIHSYWRDCEKYEYGYVKDPFGYPLLTKINFTYEGEEKPRYTDKDLIDPKTERQEKVLKGEKKRSLYVDVLRYCIFVPQEILSTVATHSSNEFAGDVILDYGVVPYQETDSLDYTNVQFPFKCYCWGYIDGEILSPVDDAINPQRFINRILSVAENQINNSRGSGSVYDKSALDPEEGEDGLLRNMNQSKPVGLNARGRGIQNVLGSYDATIKQGSMVMFNIIDIMKNHVQDTTGVNEALKGESTGSDQLVGVTQLMIQRGSLMQEPFYNAISQVFLQSYQAIATVGKRIYCDNERNLAIAVGDDGLETLKITKDMKLEDFRCFVKRSNPDEVLIKAGDNMLLQLVQLQLIDQKRFSNLFGRSTPSDVSQALRESYKEQVQVQQMQGKADQVAAQEQVQQQGQENAKQELLMNNMLQREDAKDAGNKQHDLDLIYAKSMGKAMEKHYDPKINLANSKT